MPYFGLENFEILKIFLPKVDEYAKYFVSIFFYLKELFVNVSFILFNLVI